MPSSKPQLRLRALVPQAVREIGIADEIAAGMVGWRGAYPLDITKAGDRSGNHEVLQQIIAIEIDVWADSMRRQIPGRA